MRPLFTLLRAALVLLGTVGWAMGQDAPLPRLGDRLTADQVDQLAKLVLQSIDREFPNKPGVVLPGPEAVVSPSEMYPAFYGCFDWHSAVHGHWLLVKLLKCYPDHAIGGAIRDSLDRHLSQENLQREADFFAADHNKTFERMYGWAWLLRLTVELHRWDDAQARTWRENLKPLEEVLVGRIMSYLPLLQVPIRSGEHFDTAFALGHLLDYARGVGNRELESLVVRRSRDFYLGDRDYPVNYEPSGHDFYSPGWNEADLMRRVLPRDEYSQWLSEFLPGLADGELGSMSVPMKVSDVTDGKLVHLAGLDLARTWCMSSIAQSLPESDPRRERLLRWASEHFDVGAGYVFSGHYEGEHWLGTFLLFALER